MLIGEYIHTLDPKKRLSLPSKWRTLLGEKVIITRGLDGCLFLYAPEAWKDIINKVSSLPFGSVDARHFNRYFLSGAVESEVDKNGRILIPDFLKDLAKLKTKVVLTGVNDRAEIWDETKWNEYKMNIEGQADQLAEKLNDIGVL